MCDELAKEDPDTFCKSCTEAIASYRETSINQFPPFNNSEFLHRI